MDNRPNGPMARRLTTITTQCLKSRDSRFDPWLGHRECDFFPALLELVELWCGGAGGDDV
jgi:hypothetical protein